MPDREKVIDALMLCANGESCFRDKFRNCPYSPKGKPHDYNCASAMAADVLALLKKQSPKNVYCPNCGAYVEVGK